MELFKVVEFSCYKDLQEKLTSYTGYGYWKLWDIKLAGNGIGCIIFEKVK